MRDSPDGRSHADDRVSAAVSDLRARAALRHRGARLASTPRRFLQRRLSPIKLKTQKNHCQRYMDRPSQSQIISNPPAQIIEREIGCVCSAITTTTRSERFAIAATFSQKWRISTNRLPSIKIKVFLRPCKVLLLCLNSRFR